MKKILFVHHSGSLGGGTLSLLYTIQGLTKIGFTCIVALAVPSQKLIDFYSDAGIEVISWPGITLWHHSTVSPRPWHNPRTFLYLVKVLINWRESQKRTLELVKFVQPDIVHLNSMPLSPSADILSKQNIPFVWHVREPPPDQGIRTQLIRQIMMRSNKMIFISEADRQAWVQNKKGEVIHNFVDFSRFDITSKTSNFRHKLDIPKNSLIVLYVGGLSLVKGIIPLLYALAKLKKRFPDVKCLMPGAEYQPSGSWKSELARNILPKLGSGTLAQKIDNLIQELELEDICIRLPFQEDIAPYFAACDVLVFPSTHPHFARPVIEANAMTKPVIASNVVGMSELVEHTKTGYLVSPNCPDELSYAMENFFNNPELMEKMGQFGMIKARKNFNLEHQVRCIADVYKTI
ncbi:glycosyltransferase [Leptolyngbya sp. PCC 7375]|nr:glycosyltransferase [Leptolyngbya sp. PCC 7375]